MTIANGYDDILNFRSAKGASIATSRAVKVIYSFVHKNSVAALSKVRELLENNLVKKIQDDWLQQVLLDYQKSAFIDQELQGVREKYGEEGVTNLLENPQLAYSTSMIAVVVMDKYAFFLQKGNGNIFTIMEDGKILRPLLGNEIDITSEITPTYNKKSLFEYRSAFYDLSDWNPEVIMLTSKGYSNTFQNNAEFIKSIKAIIEVLKKNGINYVSNNFKEWLKEVSTTGEEDVTAGILYRY